MISALLLACFVGGNIKGIFCQPGDGAADAMSLVGHLSRQDAGRSDMPPDQSWNEEADNKSPYFVDDSVAGGWHRNDRPTKALLMDLTSQILHQQVLHLLTIYNTGHDVDARGPERNTFDQDDDENVYNTITGKFDRGHVLRPKHPREPQFENYYGPEGKPLVGQTLQMVSKLKESMITLMHLRNLMSTENDAKLAKDKAEIDNGALQNEQNERENPNDLKESKDFDSKTVNVEQLLERNYHQTHCRSIGDRCGWMLPSCCETDLKYNTNAKLCCRKDVNQGTSDTFKGLYGVCLPQVFEDDPCPSK